MSYKVSWETSWPFLFKEFPGQLENQLAFFVAGVPELCPYLFSLLNPILSTALLWLVS
jgi:hypothetical protein